MPLSQGNGKLLDKKICFLVQIERNLGECKIVVVIETRNDFRPIVAIAHATEVQIS